MMYHKIKEKASQALSNFLENERERLFLWTPVLIGCGIGIYFALSFEPSLYWTITPLSLSIILTAVFYRTSFRIIAFIPLLIALGFCSAKIRTDLINTPMLSKPVPETTYTAKILFVEHRPDNIRLTMEDDKHVKFRIVLRGDNVPETSLKTGDTIKVNAVLMPPSEPVVLYGYNFRLQAYYKGLSAVGFATSKPVVISHEQASFRNRLRAKINEYFRTQMPGNTGAIAAALVTGDRSGISKELRNSFADSGLAHILAISGLHLSIIAGLMFFMIRRLLCFIPRVALDYPTKKIAAFISILVTGFYLYLCWESVPAARAFLMTSIIMLAIMIDRDAITMRNVAIAASIILLIMPEAMLGPSFQLSFAAVIAIVSLYENYKYRNFFENLSQSYVRKSIWFVFSILLTSLAASLATMPYTIYTFNKFSLIGIVTNIVAIPMMSFLIMPCVLAVLVLMPFGLEGLFVSLLNKSLMWLIGIAHYGESIEQGIVITPEMSTSVLIVITLSGLWWAFWRVKIRYLGCIGIAVAVLMYFSHSQPEILIAPGGKQVGVFNQKDLVIVGRKNSEFISNIWQSSLGHTKPVLEHNNNYYKAIDYNIVIKPKHRVYVNFKQDIDTAISSMYRASPHSIKLSIDDDQSYIIKLKPKLKIINIRSEVGDRPWSVK